MYEETLREEVSQGDVFQEVPFSYVALDPATLEPETTVTLVAAMMFTYDCEFGKRANNHAHIAEVRPLVELGRMGAMCEATGLPVRSTSPQ